MRKSILRYFIFIFSLALVISTLLTATLMTNQYLKQTKQELLYAVKLIDYTLEPTSSIKEQIDSINPYVFSDDTRITIIDYKGNVLADTSHDTIEENHLSRSEVKDALQSGVGFSTRHSSTTGEDYLYVAYTGEHFITRLATPYYGIQYQIHTIVPTLLISTVVAFIISYILARRLSRSICTPINEICESLDHLDRNFKYKSKEYKYEEYNVIVKTIENLSHRLRKTLKENKIQQRKIDEILKQMNEGFVLLDNENKILNINDKAKLILGNLEIDSQFTPVVYIKELMDALKNPMSTQYLELKINHLYYACYISRKKLGTTLLFVDITSTKQNDKMRRDFFSNISHELKTPMTSIRGYSELLSQGIIEDETKKKHMFDKIQSEVDRMMNLINDILMLSRIEYMGEQEEYVPIRLDSIVDDILDRYELQIENKDISVYKDCADIIYYSNHSHIYTLLSNLISNAIKYNKDKGTIILRIRENENEISIVIEDTGIGIPLKDHSRVFERFYRVDKARSRQSGGTGLGLAIVKHIVSSLNGVIKLKSEENIGTKIEVVLPKK